MRPTCSGRLGCSEALLLSAAGQLGRGGTPAHPLCPNTAARSPQGLPRLRYGLSWATARDTDTAREQLLCFGIILITRTYPVLTEWIVSPCPSHWQHQNRGRESNCAVSEEVPVPQDSQLVGEQPFKTPFPDQVVLIVARLNALKSAAYVCNEKMAKQ